MKFKPSAANVVAYTLENAAHASRPCGYLMGCHYGSPERHSLANATTAAPVGTAAAAAAAGVFRVGLNARVFARQLPSGGGTRMARARCANTLDKLPAIAIEERRVRSG